MSRVLVVEHAATCPPARLSTWLTDAGVRLDVVRPALGDELPALDDVDGLVVLGGEMGAYDDVLAPWLPATRILLADAVATGLPTLAVCLGHQLLAVAAGGRVTRSATGPHRGLHAVGLTPAAATDPLFAQVPAGAQAVHWNGDVVASLPRGAVELARTSAGPQAYRIGKRAWGVQFHPEVDLGVLRGWAGADVAAGQLEPDEAADLLAVVEAADAALVATWSALAARFAVLTEGTARTDVASGRVG